MFNAVGKKYTRDSNPVKHLRVCREESLCNGVSRVENLEQHKDPINLQSVLVGGGTYQFVKVPRWSLVLSDEQRVNNPEKSFKSIEHGKNFSQSTSLVQHQRTHTREKPCECSKRGKAFSWHFILSKH